MKQRKITKGNQEKQINNTDFKETDKFLEAEDDTFEEVDEDLGTEDDAFEEVDESAEIEDIVFGQMMIQIAKKCSPKTRNLMLKICRNIAEAEKR